MLGQRRGWHHRRIEVGSIGNLSCNPARRRPCSRPALRRRTNLRTFSRTLANRRLHTNCLDCWHHASGRLDWLLLHSPRSPAYRGIVAICWQAARLADCWRHEPCQTNCLDGLLCIASHPLRILELWPDARQAARLASSAKASAPRSLGKRSPSRQHGRQANQRRVQLQGQAGGHAGVQPAGQ